MNAVERPFITSRSEMPVAAVAGVLNSWIAECRSAGKMQIEPGDIVSAMLISSERRGRLSVSLDRVVKSEHTPLLRRPPHGLVLEMKAAWPAIDDGGDTLFWFEFDPAGVRRYSGSESVRLAS